MKVTETSLPGVLLVEPDVHGDSRGFFMEAWNEQRYRELGIDASFVQSNVSRSAQGVLRGLHFQNPNPQGKLVQVLDGEVFDVAVDIRRGSPTFGRWCGITLSADNLRQLYVPPGFAHGFCVTSATAIFAYKCTDVYNPAAEGSIRWDDEEIGIDWPSMDILLSEKDRQAPALKDIPRDRLPSFSAGTG